MRRPVLLFLLAAMLVPWVPTSMAAAPASPAYYETTVVMDAVADDFLVNGGFDIVGVYATERYRFDFEKLQDKGTAVYFRIESADMSSIPGNANTRFHLFANVAGTATEYWVDVTMTQDRGVQPQASSAGIDASTNQTSVLIAVPYGGPVAVGAQFTEVWAATSLPAGDQRVFQDVLPSDNGGAPAGQKPASTPSGAGSYTAVGPYPFVDLVDKGPLELMSSEGAEVRFRFEVVPASGLKAEIVKFYFAKPAGWNIEPSRGEGGANPVGEISNIGAPNTVSFDVAVEAVGVREPNETAVIQMEMISQSGAHEFRNLTVVVTPPRFDSDAYTFELVSGNSYSSGGTSRLEFQVGLTNGSALPAGSTVSVDFFKEGVLVETVTAQGANGTYVAEYSFPSGGAWVADVYLANLRPSPHRAFSVDVGGGGFMPGPSPVWLLVAVAASAVLMGRPR